MESQQPKVTSQPEGCGNPEVAFKEDPEIINKSTPVEEYVEEPDEEIKKINPNSGTSLAQTSQRLIEEFEEIIHSRNQTGNMQEPQTHEPMVETHHEIDIKTEHIEFNETLNSITTLENEEGNSEALMERNPISSESSKEENIPNVKGKILYNLQIRQPSVDIKKLWWQKKNILPTIEIPDKNMSTQVRKEILCPLCGKIFQYRKQRRRHEQTHHRIVPIPCETCDRTFFRKHALINHQKVHKKKEPFNCSLCKRIFTRRYNLKKHIQLAHKNSSKPEEDKITSSFPPVNTPQRKECWKVATLS